MASARTDNVNLILTINAIQSAKTLQEMEQRARDLRRMLSKIPVDSAEFKKGAAELQKLDTKIKETKAGMAAMKQETMSFGAAWLRIGGIIAVVGGAVRTFFSALSGSAKMEQLNIAFEVFLGNADKAKKVVADLRKFADLTPFETEPVNQAGRALLAFGFTAEELIPTLTRIGDVASGTGKDFNELVLIYGKARAEGRIQNDTLNQLAEAGIPIYEELAKVLKVNESQIRKMAEQGKIGFNDLQRVFVNLTSEGGRFAGLMERQSKSLDGLFSTLVSAIQNKLTSAMNGLLPVIKAITQGFIDFLNVPLSETLEQERQAFNGLALSIMNTEEGTEARTKAVKAMQEQYPDFLGNINAEKATNEELKPILDQINQSYVIRIALQKQQEKLQPLLEAQAEQENRLAEGRTAANRLLARGAELAGVNLQQFQTQAEQTQAVIEALNQTAEFRSAGGFDQPLNEQARVLNQIKANLSGIDATTIRQKFATQQATEAEQQRQEVVAELRKTYADVFAILDAQTVGSDGEPQVTGDLKKDTEAAIGSLAYLRKVISDLQKEIENTPGDSKALAPLIAQLNQADSALKALELRIANLKNPPGDVAPSDEEISRALGIPTAEKTGEMTEAQRVAIVELNDSRVAEEQLTTDELNKLRDGLSDEDALRRQRERDEEEARLHFKQDISAAEMAVITDVFDLGISLLGRDEAARKRYAAALKAFKIGEVITSGIMEVQRIYAKYALVPGGPALAQAEAIPAIIRTAIAAGKIAGTKFAGGGFTGPGFGAVPDSTGHRPVGVVHANEWVSPPWMTHHPVYGAQISMLESVRQRGFADGGFATTPTVNIVPGAGAGSAAAVGMEGMSMMAEEFRAFRREVRDWQGRIAVVYTDIEEVGTEVSRVRVEASV